MIDVPARLQALAERWSTARAAERANTQSYITELCAALEVEPPRPAGSGYEFEFPVKIGARDGTESQGFVDCYKAGHFVLEAKDADAGASDAALRRAYGQARIYALNDPSGTAPPYLLVLDVGKTLLVWHRWNGTYQGYAAGHRIDLRTLHTRDADIALLRDIWTRPAARDPRQHAQQVTQDIATKLAELAAALEDRGFDQERVARFLMRVVFSCFAEDVDLLPRDAFRQTVERAGVAGDPDRFARALEALWQAMDAGGMFGYESLLRFNGHFFRDAEALPLTKEEIVLLLESARADWKDVEPSIFGTLLTRALDAQERHRLGAEYTPRAFIERLVRPTVEEPVRERWTAVQAEVLQLQATGRPIDKRAAEQRIRDFLAWLRGLTVLDPACGSGNFLYVTMHILKDVEYEAQRELEAITGHPELRMQEIGPWNFRGIEVKPWAREIAELTLWIGFHQYWKRHHHVQPPEPVLQDTGTLELRDAVLTWTSVSEDPSKASLDPTPRLRHHVTGELVPDPDARRPYVVHHDATAAAWPAADFIVGNPPYLGAKRMREALGDGYVDALRTAYPDIADSADYVAFWWRNAARAVASGVTLRAGLITTNSITQVHQRGVIASAREQDVRVCWAAPDHPWVDEADGAAVRVALTVLARDPATATFVTVGEDRAVTSVARVPRLNDDLSPHADVPAAAAVPLRANAGIASMGFALHGHGFVLTSDEARSIIAADASVASVLKPYRAGKDLLARARDTFVIDFGYMEEEEARAFPVLFDLVRDRVKPERDANRREVLRRYWWRFGWPRRELRAACAGLPRFIVTTETAKHRVFTFLDARVAADHGIVCIAIADAFLLGVLSSSIHRMWASAAGSTLEDRPRYTKTVCFDPFPFPDATSGDRATIAQIAEALVAHREKGLATSESVSVTGMYNVAAKLRRGEPLATAEQDVHKAAACGVLNDLHDALDEAVAKAYGWSWPEPSALILERLVALHDARVEEERRGHVRWLRPDYQAPRFGGGVEAATPELEVEGSAPPATPAARAQWPADAVGQITALRQLVADAPRSVEEAVGLFAGAPAAIVQRHLETLAILGEVREVGGGRFAGALVPA